MLYFASLGVKEYILINTQSLLRLCHMTWRIHSVNKNYNVYHNLFHTKSTSLLFIFFLLLLYRIVMAKNKFSFLTPRFLFVVPRSSLLSIWFLVFCFSFLVSWLQYSSHQRTVNYWLCIHDVRYEKSIYFMILKQWQFYTVHLMPISDHIYMYRKTETFKTALRIQQPTEFHQLTFDQCKL